MSLYVLQIIGRIGDHLVAKGPFHERVAIDSRIQSFYGNVDGSVCFLAENGDEVRYEPVGISFGGTGVYQRAKVRA